MQSYNHVANTATSFPIIICNNSNSLIQHPVCPLLAPSENGLDWLNGTSNNWPSVVFSGTFLFGCLLIITVILGNVLIVVIFSVNQKLRVLTNYWIISLSATDLLLGIVVMPIAMTTVATDDIWVFGALFCDFFISLDVLCCTCSIYHLVIISLDRFFCVKYPLQYLHKRTKFRILMVLGIVWFWCIGLSCVRLFFTTDSHSPNQCHMTNTSYMIFSSVLSFYLPLIVIMTTYSAMYRTTQHRTKIITNKYLSKKVEEMTGNVKRLSRQLSKRASTRRPLSKPDQQIEVSTAAAVIVDLPSNSVKNGCIAQETVKGQNGLAARRQDSVGSNKVKPVDHVHGTLSPTEEDRLNPDRKSSRGRTVPFISRNSTRLKSQQLSNLTPELHDTNVTKIDKPKKDSPSKSFSNFISSSKSHTTHLVLPEILVEDFENSCQTYEQNIEVPVMRNPMSASSRTTLLTTLTNEGSVQLSFDMQSTEPNDVDNDNHNEIATNVASKEFENCKDDPILPNACTFLDLLQNSSIHGDNSNIDCLSTKGVDNNFIGSLSSGNISVNCTNPDWPTNVSPKINLIERATSLYTNTPTSFSQDLATFALPVSPICATFEAYQNATTPFPKQTPSSEGGIQNDTYKNDLEKMKIKNEIEIFATPVEFSTPSNIFVTSVTTCNPDMKSPNNSNNSRNSRNQSSNCSTESYQETHQLLVSSPSVSSVQVSTETTLSLPIHSEIKVLPITTHGSPIVPKIIITNQDPDARHDCNDIEMKKPESLVKLRDSLRLKPPGSTLLKPDTTNVLQLPSTIEIEQDSSDVDEDTSKDDVVEQVLLDSPRFEQIYGPKETQSPRLSSIGKLIQQVALSQNTLVQALSGVGDMPKRFSNAQFLNVAGRGGNPAANEELRKMSRLERSRQRQERRAGKVILIVISSFIACWAPFFIVNIVDPICKHSCVSQSTWTFVTWLGYANSALNPFIYTAFNRTFRGAIVALFTRTSAVSSKLTALAQPMLGMVAGITPEPNARVFDGDTIVMRPVQRP